MSEDERFHSSRRCPYCDETVHIDHPWVQLSIPCPSCEGTRLENAKEFSQDTTEFVPIAGGGYWAKLRAVRCLDCGHEFKGTHNIIFKCGHCKEEFRISNP